MKSPVSGSKEAVGSSNNKTFGLLIRAFAKLTRFFWPEDNSPVYLSRRFSILSFSER